MCRDRQASVWQYAEIRKEAAGKEASGGMRGTTVKAEEYNASSVSTKPIPGSAHWPRLDWLSSGDARECHSVGGHIYAFQGTRHGPLSNEKAFCRTNEPQP